MKNPVSVVLIEKKKMPSCFLHLLLLTSLHLPFITTYPFLWMVHESAAKLLLNN